MTTATEATELSAYCVAVVTDHALVPVCAWRTAVTETGSGSASGAGSGSSVSGAID